jgi:hypothetical protein
LLLKFNLAPATARRWQSRSMSCVANELTAVTTGTDEYKVEAVLRRHRLKRWQRRTATRNL